jgi:AcrR family transcriptional regulator
LSKKDTILRTAAKLFSKKGYRDTSVAELSKMTGAAEGTIFYHFKTKEELFLAVLENAKEQIIADFERYLGGNKFETGLDMMEGVIYFYLYLATTSEDPFRLLHQHCTYELADVNPVCRGLLEAIYNCLVEVFEHAIEQGQKDGSIGIMPARKTALILFSMVDGMVRFKNLNLYDVGALYDELLASCRKILQNQESLR